VAFAVCRHKSRFRDWLMSEFPVLWGAHAERTRQRIDARASVVDLGIERSPPKPAL
jgi:hypothetical protein